MGVVFNDKANSPFGNVIQFVNSSNAKGWNMALEYSSPEHLKKALAKKVEIEKKLTGWEKFSCESSNTSVLSGRHRDAFLMAAKTPRLSEQSSTLLYQPKYQHPFQKQLRAGVASLLPGETATRKSNNIDNNFRSGSKLLSALSEQTIDQIRFQILGNFCQCALSQSLPSGSGSSRSSYNISLLLSSCLKPTTSDPASSSGVTSSVSTSAYPSATTSDPIHATSNHSEINNSWLALISDAICAIPLSALIDYIETERDTKTKSGTRKVSTISSLETSSSLDAKAAQSALQSRFVIINSEI